MSVQRVFTVLHYTTIQYNFILIDVLTVKSAI